MWQHHESNVTEVEVVEVLIAVGVISAVGALKFATKNTKAAKQSLAHHQSVGRLIMEACEAAEVEGFTWISESATLLFEGQYALVSAPQVNDSQGTFERFELTLYVPSNPLTIKEASRREARRRLLRGFGIDGQFGISGKDDEILEWLTEELAHALVDASDGGWTLLSSAPDTSRSPLDVGSNSHLLSLSWCPEEARAPAQFREELERLMPLAARAARAWNIGKTKPERLAKLARSRTASSEVNWRAAQLLLTKHAKHAAACALTSSLDELSEHAQMACATWGECKGLSDEARSMLLRDVVLKGPEPMVDALVERLAKEGVSEVHVKALKALTATGFDLSTLKRRVGALDGLLGGQLSVADRGPRGALSEAASSNLRGAITVKNGDET